jgi:hypothetical protein
MDFTALIFLLITSIIGYLVLTVAATWFILEVLLKCLTAGV